ncbi:MAG: hypothetical protein ABWZ63_11270 [Thermoleophilaceae bacterium]
MFSTTIKRSVATLGVAAGLLAAAVPASAQGGGADFTRFVVDGPITAKAEPAATQLGAANDVSQLSATEAKGTQVGSEGVNAVLDTGMLEHEWLKAPTKADDRGPLGYEGGTADVFELNSHNLAEVAMEKNDTLHARTNPSFHIDMGTTENSRSMTPNSR